MKRLLALLVLLGLLVPMLLLPRAASAAPPLDGAVTVGTPEYENVQAAIDFLNQMGFTDVAKNLDEWLKKGKVGSHTGGDPGATGVTGNISARTDFINPSTAQDNAGNRVSINKSALKAMDKFEMIAKLAAVLLHEKVHAHQPDWYIVGSNLNNSWTGGARLHELEAWQTELWALDAWIVNMAKVTKDYQKAIVLIRIKVDAINSLLGTGYAGDGLGYGYGQKDIDHLEAQKRELEQLVAQQKVPKNEFLEDMQRMQEEKEKRGKDAIATLKSAAPFADGRPLSLRLGQTPSGPAATVGKIVTGRVVNIDLELDRTFRERDVFTLNARFTQEGNGLTLEVRTGPDSSASLSLKGRESTLASIVKAPDPVGALLLALRTGDIAYSGRMAIPLKMALGVAPTTANFEVKKGETKAVQYQGQPCTLQRNALGTRTLTPSGSNQVIAVDRYGGVLGQSTTAIQKLLANAPKGLSPSAGLLAKPADTAKQDGCPSCAALMGKLILNTGPKVISPGPSGILAARILNPQTVDPGVLFQVSRLR